MSYENPASAVGKCTRAGKKGRMAIYGCAVARQSSPTPKWESEAWRLANQAKGLGGAWAHCTRWKKNPLRCVAWSDDWKPRGLRGTKRKRRRARRRRR